MKQLLINLELESSDYNWLITDIEAYPQSKEIFEIIDDFDENFNIKDPTGLSDKVFIEV